MHIVADISTQCSEKLKVPDVLDLEDEAIRKSAWGVLSEAWEQKGSRNMRKHILKHIWPKGNKIMTIIPDQMSFFIYSVDLRTLNPNRMNYRNHCLRLLSGLCDNEQ